MTTQIPTPERTNNNKVIGEFYPLQKDELIALRQAKLINNAAFVHLALRYENPFCDRPVEILPKEFALRWSIPESSVYEAIGRLKKLGVLLIKRGKVIIEWVRNKINIPVVVTELCPTVDLSQEADSDTNKTLSDSTINSEGSKTLWDSRINSEIPESILRSQNNLRDPRINSEMSEKRSPEGLSKGDSDSLQTIQTIQTNQTEAVAEEKLNIQNSPATTEEKESDKSKNLEACTKKLAREGLTKKLKPLSDSLETPKSGSGGKVVHQNDNHSQISAQLKARLEELNIPLDAKVSKAIASHHISQVDGALAHIENTWESIKNPRGVFLYQLPKQPIERRNNYIKHFTASDFAGYTIEHLKVVYPNNWREAAIHYGLEVPEEEKM
jgi:hypothetical protein